MTTGPGLTKADIRTLLWDVTRLGGELASTDDDHLDDADLALDSLTLTWVIVRLEQYSGRTTSADSLSLESLHTVNALYAFATGRSQEGQPQ
ncbi:phosphopantetheine-binding protein [Nocardia alni]|uniref:phosphopantetheine-binding protein n=1 Tax=Nocardia alni TaxID=2815723 RepID=UPI001C24A562|nr:phosphopantetheine-binding protein [Nocardia alni]